MNWTVSSGTHTHITHKYAIHIATSLVWPSHFSRLSQFLQLIDNTTFVPKLGLTITAKVVENCSNDIPVPHCEECDRLLMKSKIIEKIKDVKWNLLDTSIYNIKTEVVSIYIVLYIIAMFFIHAPIFL